MFRLRHPAGVKRVDPSGPRQSALSGAEFILASPQDPSAPRDPELGASRAAMGRGRPSSAGFVAVIDAPSGAAPRLAVRIDNSRQATHRIPLEQEKHMTDQQSQGDFAAGERTEPQGPVRDFAEGEERALPGPPRDFAEGEEQHAPGPPRDFAEGEERQRATPLDVVPPRPAASDPKDTEPS
jgi:hypothetical protein